MKSIKTKRLVGLALLTAIVVVLQLLGSFIRVGAFSISLVLIPMVVGASLYGPGAGAFLGGIFGLIVVIATVNGTDSGAYLMFSARPFLTIALCFIKGIAAGWAAGAVYKLFEKKLSKKNTYVGVITSAVICPIVNTGIFSICVVAFYRQLLTQWAGGTDVIYYLLFVIVGWNFLLEILVNVVVSPVVLRIINIRKKT